MEEGGGVVIRTPRCSNLGHTATLPAPVDMDVTRDADTDEGPHKRLSSAHGEAKTCANRQPDGSTSFGADVGQDQDARFLDEGGDAKYSRPDGSCDLLTQSDGADELGDDCETSRLDERQRTRADGGRVGICNVLLMSERWTVLVGVGFGILTLAPRAQPDRQKKRVPMANSQSKSCIYILTVYECPGVPVCVLLLETLNRESSSSRMRVD